MRPSFKRRKHSFQPKELLVRTCQLTGLSPHHIVDGRTSREVSDILAAAAVDKEGLYVHSEFATACGDFVECGVPDVIATLQGHSLPLSQVSNVTEALIAQALAKRVYREFGPVLSKYRGEKT